MVFNSFPGQSVRTGTNEELTLFAKTEPIPVFSPATYALSFQRSSIVNAIPRTIDPSGSIKALNHNECAKKLTYTSLTSPSNSFKHNTHNLISPLILLANNV